MKCIRCGCTDERACVGGCYWLSRKPPVCSRCVEKQPEADPLELLSPGRAFLRELDDLYCK